VLRIWMLHRVSPKANFTVAWGNAGNAPGTRCIWPKAIFTPIRGNELNMASGQTMVNALTFLRCYPRLR
jgi:hypothetical protein